MNRLPIHQPPPAPVVAELVRAGLSWSTVMAMDSWKANEVLDLLRLSGRGEVRIGPGGPTRGSI